MSDLTAQVRFQAVIKTPLTPWRHNGHANQHGGDLSFCRRNVLHALRDIPWIFLGPQFQKVSVAHYLASPNGTQAIIPQLMLLHSPQRIYLRATLHHLYRYQSFPSWYIVPATNKQMAFPPNNTTARSTEESIHLSWLACLRHLRYDIPNGFHFKLKIPMAHYPAFIGAIRVFIAHLCYGMAQQDLP